jgi:hypothetical protein
LNKTIKSLKKHQSKRERKEQKEDNIQSLDNTPKMKGRRRKPSLEKALLPPFAYKMFIKLTKDNHSCL